MPRSKQKITLGDLRVGIFVLAGLAVTGFLILNSSGSFNPFEKKLKLKTRFQSADGLHSGADVQLAGVSIGKVDNIEFLPPDAPDGQRIEATLSVSETFDKKPISDYIRTDSTAQMVATSILGNDKMINIVPGTEKGAPIDNNAMLKSAATNSLSQLTETGNDLFKQLNKLAGPANDILTKANNGDGTLGRVINDERLYNDLDNAVADTRSTMVRLQTTIDKVNKGQGSAGKLVNDPALYNSLNSTVAQLESISKDIRAGRGSAGKFINDEQFYAETRAAVAELRKSAEKISSIADDVKSITTDINAGRGTAGKLIRDEQFYNDARDAIAKFNSTATRVDMLLSDAQAGKGTVGKLLTDETLYNSINQTAGNVSTLSSEGTKLMYDFRQNPKKFLRIKLALF